MGLTILTTDYGVADTPRHIAGRLASSGGQNQFQSYYTDGELYFLPNNAFFQCQFRVSNATAFILNVKVIYGWTSK